MCSCKFCSHARKVGAAGTRDQLRKGGDIVVIFCSHARKVGAEGTRDQIRKGGGIVVSFATTRASLARQGLVTNYARAVV